MGYDWFKMHSKGWLQGSIRAQLTIEERSVWADLLAFANECRERGFIARAPGIPFAREYLADYFQVPTELLNSTIKKCQNDVSPDGTPRLVVNPDDTITIGNWERYQAVPDDKKRLTGRELELYQRQRLNRDAAKFPIEAANVPEVKAIIEGELNDKNTT